MLEIRGKRLIGGRRTSEIKIENVSFDIICLFGFLLIMQIGTWVNLESMLMAHLLSYGNYCSYLWANNLSTDFGVPFYNKTTAAITL